MFYRHFSIKRIDINSAIKEVHDRVNIVAVLDLVQTNTTREKNPEFIKHKIYRLCNLFEGDFSPSEVCKALDLNPRIFYRYVQEMKKTERESEEERGN